MGILAVRWLDKQKYEIFRIGISRIIAFLLLIYPVK